MPRDRFGREIDYLRLSVIDHCNLRCVYCMPLRGLSFVPSPELLTAAEIETVARAAVAVGFRKFRLTGGEPTLRPDIVEIIERIAAVPGVDGLAMTTNGILLPRLARPLRDAGLHAAQHPRGHARSRAAQDADALRLARRDGGRASPPRRRPGSSRSRSTAR